MFNNTSKVLPYSSIDTAGIILPYSEKILNAHDLNIKIAKVKRHIEHLTTQLSQRNTHGGKSFREKNVSLKNQITLASNRLHLLQTAKVMVRTVERVADPLLTAISAGNRVLGVPAPIGFSLRQSSTIMFQWGKII